MSTATSDQLEMDRDDRPTLPLVRSHDASRVIPLVGRVLFSAIFVLSAPRHFSPAMVDAAAAHHVPVPELLVPLAGVFAAAGGLGVLFGYKAKSAALLLVLFLVPVTLFMHPLGSADFMKNVGLLGGALFIAYFGAGPISADARFARMHVRMLRDEEAS